jgi:glutathione S-transferase
VARFQLAHLGKTLADLDPKVIPRGVAALQRMEDGLAGSSFLVGEALSLADVALVAYTRVAEEGGGFELAGYPRIQAWIDRVEAALNIAA